MWYSISLTVGIIFIAISISLFYNTFHLIHTEKRTIAKVAKLEVGKGKNGRSYTPYFSIQTDSNVEVFHKYHLSTSSTEWKVGDELIAYYDPNDVENSIVLTYFDAFGMAIATLIFGLTFICIGGGYYLSQLYFGRLST